MTCNFTVVHHAMGRLDVNAEGQDIKANALIILRPTRAPTRSEILYAPAKIKDHGGGTYAADTPHGEIRFRFTGVYGAAPCRISYSQSYMILMGATGRTARIDLAR
ncbi:hypothetical protein [Polycladidibacter stylochi]|uniref:hypothetical protein n=1 Tax=Polycladidibacter stylochi TaxID=1807766 RepID=UPI000AE056A5|nr:hypothetical protein [Pseudovibrio stylochi]